MVELTTDNDCSGGIRGIIELTILRQIIEEVGHGIPIQELFDLAIGTSTGKKLKFAFPQFTLIALRWHNCTGSL